MVITCCQSIHNIIMLNQMLCHPFLFANVWRCGKCSNQILTYKQTERASEELKVHLNGRWWKQGIIRCQWQLTSLLVGFDYLFLNIKTSKRKTIKCCLEENSMIRIFDSFAIPMEIWQTPVAHAANTVAPIPPCMMAEPQSRFTRTVVKRIQTLKWARMFLCFCLHGSFLLLTQTNLDNISDYPPPPYTHPAALSLSFFLPLFTRTSTHRKYRCVARSRAQNAQQAGPADG